MGWKELFRPGSDGFAYEPTRDGFRLMMQNGKPVRVSELSKGMRKSTGQSTKPQRRPKNTDKFWR